jgi:hypothetical protein
MDSENERYYRVLNLEPTASPEDVYQAYRDLVRIWDPQRFVTQPNLELMAEAKLKEIIEAYNALTAKKDVSETPASAETPQLLTPVPDHVIDRNFASPIFTPGTPVTPDPGARPEEPPVARPLSAWEQERPASYPHMAPVTAAPTIHFPSPPPPPPRPDILKLAAQFSAFLVPLALVALGLYLYDSGSNRADRQNQSPPQETAGAKSRPTPAPSHRAAKKASQPVAEEAEAPPISLPNGTQLMPPQGRTGAGRFRIANHSGRDAVVRVTAQGYPGMPLRLVYVQAGTEVPIEGISTGVYMVSISLGTLTRAPRKFAPPLGPFQFMQIESADGGSQSDDYELVLKPSP